MAIIRCVNDEQIGLFADLEVRMIKGPLFVGQEYLLEREVNSMFWLDRLRVTLAGGNSIVIGSNKVCAGMVS